MNELDRYQALRTAVDAAQRRVDRAQGAYEQSLKQLVDRFQCSTLKSARVKLAELEQALETQQGRFGRELKAFETKWADAIAR